jgi:hypothetical protein
MNKTKTIFFLLTLFLASVISSFYFENSYRTLVRFFFKFFQGDNIKFGKNFHLFASYYFTIGFGLYCVLLSLMLYRQNSKARQIYLLASILLFFITTITTSFFDSTSYIVECTVCQDGVRFLNYNEINYDAHFILSLAISLLPLIGINIKKQITILRQRNPSFNNRIAASRADSTQH